MDFEQFVASRLPDVSVRVLEIGCGSGELAVALGARGYDIVAIDPQAPEGLIFRRDSLENFVDPELFDAAIASRSLHHIADLRAGVDKIHDLLRPGGQLILNEFAWDRLDDPTARWYVTHANVLKPGVDPSSPEEFLREWIAEHDDLHGLKAMTTALERRFRRELFEWIPYIGRHYLKSEDLEREEEKLIASRQIQPIGFRFVGRRM